MEKDEVELAPKKQRRETGDDEVELAPKKQRRETEEPNDEVSTCNKLAGAPLSMIRPPESVVGPVKSTGEGSSRVCDAAATKFEESVVYRLYFKGLVAEAAMVAGIGAAICDQADNLLSKTKERFSGAGVNREGAEIRALIRGLSEAVRLGIKRVAIYCDYHPIYQFVSGGCRVAEHEEIASLLSEAQRLRRQLISSKPVLVDRNGIKFVFELAMEAMVSETDDPVDSCQVNATKKETCIICFDDADEEGMFSVDKCLHHCCFSCVQRYVEVKLKEGNAPRCLHDGCSSELTLGTCSKLLTPDLIEMWEQRIKEDSVPAREKVYCPYPWCSALMYKTELSGPAADTDQSGVRTCVKCRRLFCVDCKVEWHTNLSCADYKKLHPNPPADDEKLKSLADHNKWRQCVKCHHMIERSEGCIHMTCRCGHEFCYNCGAEWNKKLGESPSACSLSENGEAEEIESDQDEDYDGNYYEDNEGRRWRSCDEYIDHQIQMSRLAGEWPDHHDDEIEMPVDHPSPEEFFAMDEDFEMDMSITSGTGEV